MVGQGQGRSTTLDEQLVCVPLALVVRAPLHEGSAFVMSRGRAGDLMRSEKCFLFLLVQQTINLGSF